MTKVLEKKILEKLDRLEEKIEKVHRAITKTPRRKELTEEDVLKIVEEGDREYQEGKTVVLNSLRDLE